MQSSSDPQCWEQVMGSLINQFTGLPHCGKTSIIKRLQEGGPRRFAILDTQHFYVDEPPISPEEYNYDLPEAVEWDLFISAIEQLRRREAFERPVYDKEQNRRIKGETKTITPSDIVIVEGPLVLWNQKVRSLLDLKIYIDTDRDVALSRRIMSKFESLQGNEKALEKFISKYLTKVKPAFEKYVEPSKRHADIVIPNYGFQADTFKSQSRLSADLEINSTAIDLLLRKLYSYFGDQEL